MSNLVILKKNLIKARAFGNNRSECIFDSILIFSDNNMEIETAWAPQLPIAETWISE